MPYYAIAVVVLLQASYYAVRKIRKNKRGAILEKLVLGDNSD